MESIHKTDENVQYKFMELYVFTGLSWMTGDPVASLFGAAKDVTYQTRLFFMICYDGCFVWYLADVWASQFDPNISLCVSLSGRQDRVYSTPLTGKSVVITSTSGPFYGPLNQSSDHYFICVVKYHTLSLLLFISELLTRYFKLIWLC